MEKSGNLGGPFPHLAPACVHTHTAAAEGGAEEEREKEGKCLATLDRNVHAIEGVSVSFYCFRISAAIPNLDNWKKKREAVPKKKKRAADRLKGCH